MSTVSMTTLEVSSTGRAPSEAIEEIEADQVLHGHMGSIYSILTYADNPSPLGRQVMHIVAKLFLSSLAFIAEGADLEATRRNFENKVMAEISAYGGALAWGTLSTYCMAELYDQIFVEPDFKLEKRNLVSKVAFWASVFFLGLMTEIPTIYTSWYYNPRNPFFYTFTPAVFSVFAALSVDEFLKECMRENNFIRRRFVDEETLKNIKIQERFIELMEFSKISIPNFSDNELNKFVIESNERDTNKLEKIQLVMQNILSSGALEKNKEWRSEIMSRIKSGVKIIALICPIGSSILDGVLVYNGYNLIFTNQVPLPIIIFFAVGPGVYLQVKFTQDVYCSILDKGVKWICPKECSFPSISKVGQTIVKCIVLGLLVFFGSLGDITISSDNLPWNLWGLFVMIGAVSTTSIILFSSLSSIYDGLLSWGQKKCRSVRQIQEDQITERLDCLERYFSQVSSTDFRKITNDLNLESYLEEVDQDSENVYFSDVGGRPEIQQHISSLVDPDEQVV